VRRLAEVARRLSPWTGRGCAPTSTTWPTRGPTSERARRLRHLQEVEALYDPIPVDAAAARAFGEIVSAARRSGRQPRRQSDLLIAAVARAHRLALATRHPVGFTGPDDLVEVHAV
jgi:tRNA(fMet)-specific endonuclease VapC